ncbi:MAG: hypothetical protein QNJ55_27505 [Xenococcus sp. MO_188.B8]|nr:hypothetical protein [Xenococcus sp. MO_188.B8]
MKYYSQELANHRWGIYEEHKLLATIGCYKTCQRILTLLKASNTKKKFSITEDLRPLKQTKKSQPSKTSRKKAMV